LGKKIEEIYTIFPEDYFLNKAIMSLSKIFSQFNSNSSKTQKNFPKYLNK